ncbi:MAG: hypothetical protein M1826_003983 [Phylliscum demangeonii]|nr:MAG: hypothetical protein M1826_003983 [Phylliscum demangeonii]
MSQSLGDSLPAARDPAKTETHVPTATADGTVAASSTHPPPSTFAYQDQLPTLPIPSLESTAKRYLEALEALQTEEEHDETTAAVEEFLRTDGPKLQAKLERYASDKTSYIEQFWYDSFLNFDSPVVLNLNPFFLLEDDPTPARSNQVTRAASLVMSALAFVRAIRREELPPDMVKGRPLDMYQYSRIFGTSRIPTAHGCVIGQDAQAQHLVVLCRGQFYWFDVLDAHADTIMTEKALAANLQVIVDDAGQTPMAEAARGALGVLSTEKRKTWAGLRALLTREPGSNNADCLHIVDSALFLLCLDDSAPATSDELCMNMLCGSSAVEQGVQVGTCTNRWYDKLQMIVCGNGSAGINFEHTTVDGHTILRMASDCYTDTILRFARTINGHAPRLWASASPDPRQRPRAARRGLSPTPRKLQWTMEPALRTALRFAETRLADLIQQYEFRTVHFAGYGKAFITAAAFSPDAFVQMAFQAAYYGLYGRLECTYEPAMTKIFRHGRTEAIRSVTPAARAFVQTFWADAPSAADKIAALRAACDRHVALTKECGQAQGQDRHLYALYCVWQRQLDEEEAEADVEPDTHEDHEVEDDDDNDDDGDRHRTRPRPRPRHARARHLAPSLFADPGWATLNTTILSTSNCGNPSLRHFGFGPTSPDGFGIGYIIKDDGLAICASSKHRQTKRFVDALEAYLLEIRRLLRLVARRRRGTAATSMDASVVLGPAPGATAANADADDAHHPDHAPTSTSATTATTTATRPPGSGGGDGGRFGRGRALGPVAAEMMVAAAAQNEFGHGAGADQDDDDDDEDDGDDGDDGDEEQDGLGGYGFFDAGMLLQALQEKNELPPHHHRPRHQHQRPLPDPSKIDAHAERGATAPVPGRGVEHGAQEEVVVGGGKGEEEEGDDDDDDDDEEERAHDGDGGLLLGAGAGAGAGAWGQAGGHAKRSVGKKLSVRED